jgi:hypothetical protein
MSYIPDHLTLKNGIAQSDFIQYSNNDLVITTAGVLKIAGGSGVEASVLLSVAGTDPDDNPIKYTFPDVNIAMPEQDQIISFNSDGTSQFINNGGGGGAVNAVLNTAYPTTANAGAVLVMNGGDAVSSSPTDKIIVDPDFVTVTAVGLTIRGNAVSGTSTVISELVGEFIISNKAPNGTMLLSSEGDITLQTLANIQLTGGVNITGGDNTNNISKNGGNELLVNGENNVYLNSSAGSTFIQSTGGNVNLNCSFGLVNTDAPILIKNLGRLNVDTGSGNLFTVSNDAGPVRLYSDFPVTTQANTSNINFINDTGLFIKDRVSDFESNIKQQGDGDFKILNPNGNIDLLPLGTVNITRVEPQLNFNHTDFPTQQCNIRFQTNTEELILEHFTPDDAARCNIRLGKPDINIETTVGLIPGNINLRTGGSGKTFINEYSLPNTNPTADGQVLSCNIDGESSWVASSTPTPTYTYYVSNQGSDSNTGSIIQPFLTIQYGINIANSIPDTIPIVINVMSGQYVENLTITRNNMSIQGANATNPFLTVINGTVSVTVVSSDPINLPQVFAISNFIIFNTVSHANTTIYQNSLIVNNCILFPTSNVAPFSTTNTGLGVLKADETINNSFVYIVATPVTIDSTNLTFANTQVLNSPIFNSTSSFVNVIGSGKMSAFGAIFRNSNVSAQVQPIVVIANTIDSTNDSTINTCSFIYNSSTLDTGFGGKCGIRFNNGGSCQTYIMTNCFFKCLGATTTTGSANQLLVVQRTGGGQCTLAVGNNPCQGTNTHHLPPSGGGFTKTILTNAL